MNVSNMLTYTAIPVLVQLVFIFGGRISSVQEKFYLHSVWFQSRLKRSQNPSLL